MTNLKKLLALLLALALTASVPALAEAPAVEIEADAAFAEEEARADADGEALSVESDAVDAWVEPDPEAAEIPEANALLPGLEAAEDDAAENDAEFEANAEEIVDGGSGTNDGGADNDALFDAYAAELLGIGEAEVNRHIGYDLKGVDYYLYCKLLSAVTKIANGERTSTEITFTPGEIGAPSSLSCAKLGVSDARSASFSQVMKAMGVDFSKVTEALIHDCPYELYWYDRKWESVYWARSTSQTRKVTKICLRLYVNKSYRSGTFKLNTAKVSTVKKALQNARSIVSKYAAYSDKGKIDGYVREICALTDYNDAALKSDIRAFGSDPWALVYVFDGNSATKVVCEGYARAFKYLCDNTNWSGNVYCYAVTGMGHMWNLVTMPDNRTYHVDVTWTDSSNGKSWFVLLPATSQSAGYKYTVRCANGRQETYTYYALMRSLYSVSQLTLATSAFSDATYSGNRAVKSVSIVPGGAVQMVKGDKRTLTLAFNPSDAKAQKVTWLNSNRKVVSISVQSDGSCVVTAKKKGTATLTVRTKNEKTASITVNVAGKAELKGLSLNYSDTVYLASSRTLQLTPGYTPWNGRSKLKWSSSNKAVATVSSTGLVTPVGEGTARITVKSANKKKASVLVVVYKP